MNISDENPDQGNLDRMFLSPPHVGERERELLLAAFDSNYIAPVGPHLDLFEEMFREKTGFRHAVAVTSGTAAMHLALRCLGIGEGQVVLSSTLTFIGGVSPICQEGAEPCFVDVRPETWNLDPDLVEEALCQLSEEGARPGAVIATDLYGQCCEQERLRGICDRYGIPLVVDAAESLGARRCGVGAGSLADCAVFSFNGNKILTTSGGGMLASDDEELVAHARKLATQARESVPHYEHRELGYNYRLSNLCAAVGCAQLEKLDERVGRKREIYRLYRGLLDGCEGLSLMPIDPAGEPNFWLTTILIDRRRFGSSPEQVRLCLEEENVEARPLWKPMHRQPVFAGCRAWDRGVADRLFEEGLCLPSGTTMSDDDVARVADLVLGCSANRADA